MTGAGDETVRILAGAPSAAEVAAVTAVLTQLVAEHAEEARRITETPGPSAWRRTQRSLRTSSLGAGWSNGIAVRG